METITLFGTQPYDEHFFKKINEEKKFGYTFKFFKENLTQHTAALADGTQVVCVFVNDIVSANVVDALHKHGVRLLALRCAGFNNVDLEAAKGKIKVVRVPAYSPYAVAEYTLGLMLTLNRKIHRAVNRTHEGNFSLNGLLGFDMHQKTIGIVGTGKIAKVLINLLGGFGVNLLAYDVFPDKAFAKEHHVQYTTLDHLLSESDIISLHCPLTPETQHIINAKTLQKMKPGVMLINTGRGQLIDTRALINSLKKHHVGSIALDVYENEGKYFYQDHSDQCIEDDLLARLLSFNNVIVTSHQAFFTQEALVNIAVTTLENIQAFLANQPLVNEVKA
ncbi:MAG: 2-hydroxyacid dehydrogenase [Puniceicoccales bacterium]|jgi:D-lactate dehydrogenase|nr:2-hydroxyacid dehydrogenase [Puniceicoccales bacterium]